MLLLRRWEHFGAECRLHGSWVIVSKALDFLGWYNCTKKTVQCYVYSNEDSDHTNWF